MRKSITILLAIVVLASCKQGNGLFPKSDNPIVAQLGFEKLEESEITDLTESGINIKAAPDNAWISSRKGNITPNCLHIVGGHSKSVTFSNVSGTPASYLSFVAERWTSRDPFIFKVEEYAGEAWVEIFSGDDTVRIGNFPTKVVLKLSPLKEQKVKITVSAPENAGALIDDLAFYSDAKMVIDSVAIADMQYPVLKGKASNPVLNIRIYTTGFTHPKQLREVLINSGDTELSKSISTASIYYGNNESGSGDVLFGSEQELKKNMVFKGNMDLNNGLNNIFLQYKIDEEADIRASVSAQCSSVKIDRKKYELQSTGLIRSKLGIALRQHNDEGVDTYRIPGLATTNKGTLIAVYDIRRNSGVDLQEDVDVGMSRSTNGGLSWEPMKVVMDMGEWGGLPNDQNGIGDPAVLVDRTTNTIWVAAIWAHGHPGERNWWASKPGMEPQKTSQFVLVKSEDDGLTWSDPINITSQIKKEEWYLVLQGPGKGITMKDGTLVFPAQYKDREEMPHSTIIWSKDHGETWTIGTSAKENTTEAQVIELDDGRLMLNMRDNRNRLDKTETNGRAIATSSDLGKTWQVHPTSNGALQEPTCMASLIKEEFLIDGDKRSLVLFSNPNSKYARKMMSVKISLDDGETWPPEHQLLLDSGNGRGYSCMTKIDDENIGILYEGSQADLTFQILSVKEIMKGDDY